MVAKNINCIVVEVPVTTEDLQFMRRPKSRDLLPWADPYIAKLIRNLQDEVREERRAQKQERIEQLVASCGPQAEADPPLVSEPIEIGSPDGGGLWPRTTGLEE